MLRELLLVVCLQSSLCSDEVSKPYVFPIPFELPHRNDKTLQCWLRIEDVELIETISIFCYLAHDFLHKHIRDYNSRKMQEDDVDVSLWSEAPRNQDDELTHPMDMLTGNGQMIRDWKVTTVLDPTTRARLYVTQKADCRLIMYSRDGMTNYKVDCAQILYYVNYHMSGSDIFSAGTNLLILALIFLLLFK